MLWPGRKPSGLPNPTLSDPGLFLMGELKAILAQRFVGSAVGGCCCGGSKP